MKKSKKILLKAFIAKTMLFIATLIALTSAIFGIFYPDLYVGIPNLMLGELFVLVLLLDKLLVNRCWYSWGAYLLLVFCNLLNILYLSTDFINGNYVMIYPAVAVPIAVILAFIAIVTKGTDPTQKSDSIGKADVGDKLKVGDTKNKSRANIGGGVLIGEKPKK